MQNFTPSEKFMKKKAKKNRLIVTRDDLINSFCTNCEYECSCNKKKNLHKLFVEIPTAVIFRVNFSYVFSNIIFGV